MARNPKKLSFAHKKTQLWIPDLKIISVLESSVVAIRGGGGYDRTGDLVWCAELASTEQNNKKQKLALNLGSLVAGYKSSVMERRKSDGWVQIAPQIQ